MIPVASTADSYVSLCLVIPRNVLCKENEINTKYALFDKYFIELLCVTLLIKKKHLKNMYRYFKYEVNFLAL